MNITVFVVGVGSESDIDQATLENIAGDPTRVFRLINHGGLVDAIQPRSIRESVCNVSNLCDPHPCHVNATCQVFGSTFTCTCNVGFVGNGFICTVVQCPALTAPANGALNPTNRRQYQDQVTFTCNTGYNLVGQTSLTCLASGTWSAIPPTCNPVPCPVLTAPTNGARTPPTGSNSYPNTITFTCDSGYVLNGSPNTMCQADGSWTNPVPTCPRRQCPVLTAPTNGARTPSTGSNLYQEQITFTCNTGYDLSGVSPLTCQATGTWSNAVPTCTPRQCPVLTAPTNGARTPPTGSNSYQNMITFTCNTGYELSGVSPLTCQATGTWSNAVPTCTAVQCPVLTAPAFGSISPAGVTSYPTLVAFNCNTGYIRNGATSATCQADGTWSNPVHTCTPVQCPVLTAPTNGVRAPLTGSNFYTNTITFTCNSGYVLSGSPNTVCQADGSWSNPVPTCPRKAI
ncbi:E-selectin-like [Branchiostoma floridae x Branchiostoma japonicum]